MKTQSPPAKETQRNRIAPVFTALLAIMILWLAGCASEETSQRPWNSPDNAAAPAEETAEPAGAVSAEPKAADTERAKQAPEMARLEMEKERLRESEEAARRMQGRDASEPAPKKAELKKRVEGEARIARPTPEAPAAPAPSFSPATPSRSLAPAGKAFAAKPVARVKVDPGTLPSREEEIWVISRLDDAEARIARHDNDLPLCSHRGRNGPENQLIPMPLKHTKVNAAIDGYLATVEVTQQFHNPFSSKIEAVYVFPLPQNAAVNEFVMTIGDRRIRGIIREKQEAKRIYQAARAQGYQASLLTQERPNIFTQKVANIEPGKRIDIDLKYYNTLAWRDGWYEFVFPMVVAPRFNPAGATAGVGSIPRGRHGGSGQSTEVQYLRPKERSGHDIMVNVKLNAGVKIEELHSRTHAIAKARKADERFDISLKPLDTLPNKDFVLRWRVTGSRLKSNFITHRDERSGYFSLMLYPPDSMKSLKRKPMEMIFVIDCSGSMRGAPLRQSKDAIERALNHLEKDDTFQIIRFSNNASQLGDAPVPATSPNIHRAKQYLKDLNGSGGTQMIEGLKAALDFEHDPRRLRFVTFLTDGLIGNEADILRAIKQRLGATRIFSFGVGSSPNDYLMDRMAKLGRGAVAYLNLRDSGSEIMDRFFERVSHPALTDITIDWNGLEVEEAYPARVPDLFVGRPLVVTGKFSGGGKRNIRVRGRLANGEEIAMDVPVDLDNAETAHEGLASVWARRKIAAMADDAAMFHNPELEDQIKGLALDYSLMSKYTAFVAVDSSARTAGNFGTTVPVAVPVPDGVRYDTTVEN